MFCGGLVSFDCTPPLSTNISSRHVPLVLHGNLRRSVRLTTALPLTLRLLNGLLWFPGWRTLP
jgi:hypothetical protein